MDRKRRAEEEPQSPPKRARRVYSTPQTPALSSHSGETGAFPTPRTPYTPYPLRPSDSPSNPFGRRRTQTLIQSLPPTSSFSKHLALRFQFVRRAPSISPRQGGVYRIVQVPLNYTLVHLKCLIAFLFSTPASYHRNGANDDHLFEVKSEVTMYSPLYKPGQIRSGRTTVKLSNVRDPCRWRSQYGYGNDSEEDELDDSEEDREELDENGDEGVTEEEQDGWKWEDEEDYTLGHVWPGGLDILQGLIYHHSPSTQVHITINTTKLPRRRGSSKTPYVFNARGHVHLSAPPLPRPIFLKSEVIKTPPAPQFILPKPSPAKRVLRKPLLVEQELTDMDADGDTDVEVVANKTSPYPLYQSRNQGLKYGNILVEDSEEEIEQEDVTFEDPNVELNPDTWNEPALAFGVYLLEYMGHPTSDIDLILADDEPVTDPFDDDDDDDIVQHNSDSPQSNRMVEDQDEFDEDEEALKLELAMLSSSPGLTHHYSSSSSSQTPSSPFPPTSSPSRDLFSIRSSSSTPSLNESIFPDIEAFSLEHHYPNTKYTHTPAPPRERTHRRRMERVQKRIEKMKRQKWLCARDESVSADEEQKNEIDQLARDDDTEEKWVKPALKEGEVWDPFGDELEV